MKAVLALSVLSGVSGLTLTQKTRAGERLLSLPGTQNKGISQEKLDELRAFLEKGCGPSCVSYLDGLRESAQKSGKSIMSTIAEEAEEAARKMSEFEVAVKSNPDVAAAVAQFKQENGSFLERSAVPVLDTPCFDAKSCKMVEVLGNRCNAARVSSLAVFQSLNLPQHVLSAATKVLCGCVDVYNQSACLLRFAPFCGPIFNVNSKIAGIGEQVWEAVKATTSTCKVVGSPLLASPP
eukprot:CAMPEP_0179001052 /NCGR_PEP_ID=MMETSP0795-20121207/11082_1 /TAXON_ID=88552 /ORGANISM="Amoebophrya sp., Strain Ameob2" /LENGTH=236 /DNA_ID=CAMNT_0020694255 /DNA_START=72 /DNA_END=782 /DNA_ORIENTATION=-